MAPTEQGLILFRWLMVVAPELALPTVRADVEAACFKLSQDRDNKARILQYFIDKFETSFKRIFLQERPCQMLMSFFRKLHRSTIAILIGSRARS